MPRFLALLAATLVIPGFAGALSLGADLDIGTVVTSSVADRERVNLALRLDHDLGVERMRLELEAGAGLRGLDTRPAQGSSAGLGSLYEVFGGVRASTGERFRPGLYGRLGFGATLGDGGFFGRPSGNGLYAEAGILMDVAFPAVTIGLHAGFQSFFAGKFAERLFQESDVVGFADFLPQIAFVGVHGALPL